MKNTIEAIKSGCKKELSRWKPVMVKMKFEELSTAVFNMAIYHIYKRFNKIDSVYFSDYLKQNKGLDHLFYRIAREVEQNMERMKEEGPRKRVYHKREPKKFGVFDVQALERKRKAYRDAEKKERERRKHEFPWEIDDL